MMKDQSVIREELHFRRIDMRGYKRSDGFFEVEGRVTDKKTYDFKPMLPGNSVPTGKPIHDMGVTIVFDRDMLVIDVNTFTNAGPYAACPGGGEALKSLKGLRLSGGWSKAVRERLSPATSCTHLVQLLAPLATVAFQTMNQERQTEVIRKDHNGRPLKVDSCHAYGAHGELVRENWPEFYKPI